MQIQEMEHEGVITLATQGRLDSNTSESFNQHLTAKIDGGNHRIIIDFSSLDYISSAGLRVLLMAAKRLKSESGAFVLCGLAPHIQEVFEISGFLQILTVAGNHQDAQTAITAPT